MTVNEAIKKLDVMINTLPDETQKAVEEMAMSLVGVVVNRIQQEGLPGRKYSKNKLPEFYFFDRELNAGGRALMDKKTRRKQREGLRAAGIKVRKNKSLDEQEKGISYEEWRIANGLQVDHVDLTFSGRMMQNLGIIGTRMEGNYFVVVIGGTDPEVILKIEYTSKMFGKWLNPTDDEKKLLQQQFRNRIDNYIKRIAA